MLYARSDTCFSKWSINIIMGQKPLLAAYWKISWVVLTLFVNELSFCAGQLNGLNLFFISIF